MRFMTLVFYRHSMLFGSDIPCAEGFFKLLFNTSELHFSENIHMLSLRLQFVRIHLAYAYNLYTYTEHTHTISMRMLSIRL